MTINLDALSRDELKKLITDAEKALKSLDIRRRAEAKRAAEEAARQFGFSLEEVVSSKGGKGIAKYANPEDSSQTWTGKGRKPKWVIEALEAGKSVEELEI